MVSADEIVRPLNIGQFLNNIREKIIDELPEVAMRNGVAGSSCYWGSSSEVYSQDRSRSNL